MNSSPLNNSLSFKNIVLCADDYGLSADISAGILSLLELQRLSAVSCMTCLPDWKLKAEALQPFKNQAAIGLHFNLTESASAQPLGRIMQQSLTARINLQWVQSELNQQLDDFETQFNDVPSFIDGHQHVHVFPGIREVVMNVLLKRYPNSKIWLRRVHPSFSGHDSFTKAVALRVMSYGFASQAYKKLLPTTQAFAGLYSLTPDADFPKLLHGWMNQLPDGGLIMCHPGQTGAGSSGLALTRQREFDYLKSNLFTERLEQQRVKLSATPSFY
ncbi:MAG: ChbG/HpnK family deacetylase [Oceanospirillales bacterium]|nr:MAG: ChbG/HpnK family deacetylase [Oceanospirillales bacterium]